MREGLGIWVLLLWSCSPFSGASVFECENDVECSATTVAGTCQPNGFCSFVDPSCGSGQRYGELSGPVSNTCVDGGSPIDAPDRDSLVVNDGPADTPTGTISTSLFAGDALSETHTLTGDPRVWGTPGNTIADDDVDTSVVGFDPDEGTQRIRSHTYGFAIPGAATILGIEVEVELRASASTVTDVSARLHTGGALVGTDQPNATEWPTARTVRTYGGPTDLWGSTWTPATINAGDFGFGLIANTVANNRTTFVDYHRITIYYTP